MPKYNTIYIQKDLKNHILVSEIITKNKTKNIYYLKNNDLSQFKNKTFTDNSLCLINSRDSSLQMCPRTNEYLCCNYRLLNSGLNCPLECSYCILQDYLQTNLEIIYIDFPKRLQKTLQILAKIPNEKFRIGNGEFTDSLIHDYLTNYSLDIINEFKKYPNLIFEFKTKSLNIKNLLKIKAQKNIIVAWSLNTPFIKKYLEPKTPNLKQRLEAAKTVIDHGYDVAFHFDPIVNYENALVDYPKIIDEIYKIIPKDRIRWISMGALRFTKGLYPKFLPKSTLFIDEFIEGNDHKLRYLRPIRINLFQKIYQKIQEYNKNQFIYLCMESKDVWQDVFDFVPKDNDDFENWFNKKGILMQYTILGKTGLKTSKIGLGSWAFGGKNWGKTNDSDSIKTIHTSIEKGINFFDTAPIYGFGHAEEILGTTLKNKRENFIIASKCGLKLKNHKIVHDLSPKFIEKDLENSLKRLKTDYLDIYLLHWPDPNTNLEDTLQKLQTFKTKGLVRYIGVCNFSLELLKQALEIISLDIIQNQYSLLDTQNKLDIFPFAKENNIGILTYGTLHGGLLSGKYKQQPIVKANTAKHFFYNLNDKNLWDEANQILQALPKNNIPSQIIKKTLKESLIDTYLVGAKTPKQLQELLS